MRHLHQALKKLLKVMGAGWWADDGNCPVFYPGAESAQEAAQFYVDSGDWGEARKTRYFTILCWQDGRKDEAESITITQDPDVPACVTPQHKWQEIAVRGQGGGVLVTEECQHCPWQRITNTWDYNPENGEQGLLSIEYHETSFS